MLSLLQTTNSAQSRKPASPSKIKQRRTCGKTTTAGLYILPVGFMGGTIYVTGGEFAERIKKWYFQDDA